MGMLVPALPPFWDCQKENDMQTFCSVFGPHPRAPLKVAFVIIVMFVECLSDGMSEGEAF